MPPLFLDDDEAIAVATSLMVAVADQTTGMVDVAPTGHGATDRPLPAGDPMQFLSRSLVRTSYSHSVEITVDIEKDELLGELPWLSAERVAPGRTAPASSASVRTTSAPSSVKSSGSCRFAAPSASTPMPTCANDYASYRANPPWPSSSPR